MAIAQDQGFPGVFLDHADSIAIIVNGVAQDQQFVPFCHSGLTILVVQPMQAQ